MDTALIFAIEKIVVFEAARDLSLFRRVPWLHSNSEIGLEDDSLSLQADRIAQTEQELKNAPNR